MTSVITFTSYREISINVACRCECVAVTLEQPQGKPHHSCQGMGQVFLRKEATVVQVKYTNQVRSRDRTNSPRKSEGGKNVRLLIRTETERTNQPAMMVAAGLLKACLLLDQIKREKGVWWMPWQQEAMKDVILCDKSWGAENKL